MGSSADHPLRALLVAAEGGGDQQAAACAVWEKLLQQIEQGAPNRWQGKRREFRSQRDFSQTFSQRCELVLAAQLIRAGVAFEFGQAGRPQPDLVLQDRGLGIEVGSRIVDGAQQLEDDIRAAVGDGEPEHIQITLDIRPLAIRQNVRDRIVAMVRLGQQIDEEVVPARDNHPAVRARITRTPSTTTTTVDTAVRSTLLTPHMHDIRGEVRATIVEAARKIRQAMTMPTVLVVDVSRCGWAWLRPLATWLPVLRDVLDEHDPYVAIAVMTTGLHDLNVQLAWSANPHVEPDQTDHVARFFSNVAATVH